MTTHFLDGKHVLMILAHCDDEIVTGWPILQNPSIRKTILMVSSDRSNTDRAWCAHRKFVFMDICRRIGVATKDLDFNSDFYALEHRNGKLVELERTILRSIESIHDIDYVFTHNPFGEYGHLDHKYLFQTVSMLTSKPVVITDICMQSDWTSVNTMSDRYRLIYYSNPVGSAILNRKFYEKVKQSYLLSNTWTWSREPVESCGLFTI